MTTHKIYMEHNNNEIKVSVGDLIIIELPENPTTGYQWESVNLNSEILEEKQSVFSSSNTGVGAGGMKKFEFEVKAAQEEMINFQHVQKWSNDVFQNFTIKLLTRPSKAPLRVNENTERA